jgi:hypothetical protein
MLFKRLKIVDLLMWKYLAAVNSGRFLDTLLVKALMSHSLLTKSVLPFSNLWKSNNKSSNSFAMVSQSTITANIPTCGGNSYKLNTKQNTHPVEEYNTDVRENLQTVFEMVVAVEAVVTLEGNVQIDQAPQSAEKDVEEDSPTEYIVEDIDDLPQHKQITFDLVQNRCGELFSRFEFLSDCDVLVSVP